MNRYKYLLVSLVVFIIVSLAIAGFVVLMCNAVPFLTALFVTLGAIMWMALAMEFYRDFKHLWS